MLNYDIILGRKGGLLMDELVKMLDNSIKYLSHEIKEERIYIHVESIIEEVVCPYCGESSIWVHSRYPRNLQDLPIQGKKVTIVIDNRKYFCMNPRCEHKTFAEYFEFAKRKATMTNRLREEIISISLNQSSLSASKHLKSGTCDIGKSTICTIIKKGL
jgi:transposase